MGVPVWLMNTVMGFLSNRSMVLNYKGSTSAEKPLPGGGAQGTLLGLILFLVLINDCGFDNQSVEIGKTITQPKGKFSASNLHAKFIDDLTILEALKLDDALIENPDRPLPDPYHCRTGQKLDPEVSQILKQLHIIQNYADENEMKINFKKSQFILFNPSKTHDFLPEYQIDNENMECVESLKLLGVTLSIDLSWSKNTKDIVKKAYGRLWMIRRLKRLDASTADLKDIFIKQVRSILEYAVLYGIRA